MQICAQERVGMTRKFVLIAAPTGLVLRPASRARETPAPPAAVVQSSAPWMIRCVGMTPSVPLTADAVQALPMHLVPMLNCGDQVSVLSDVEGYTVNVRTPDGKSGYAQGMDLANARAENPAP